MHAENSPPRVAVILTCFNRKTYTLNALKGVYENADGVDIKVTLVDDGSRDGTREAVAEQFPDTKIVVGDGNLYWNGGMRRAWQEALEFKPDFYLWLNDDLSLAPKFLTEVLHEYRTATKIHGDKVIVVGKVVDPATGETSYGGYRRRKGVSKLSFELLPSGERLADTINGNCVLIPAQATEHIGINSGLYRHAFGDIDYGLRARKAGYTIVQSENPVGWQEFNAAYMDSIRTLTLKNWRYILKSPKGVPVREWFFFCRDHGGTFWPVNFAFRYVKMAAAGLRAPGVTKKAG